MKRRTLLGAGAATAALSIWPAWLARAFDPAAACDGPDARLQLLFDAYRAARREHKPLLVLVIPADDRAKWERGELWGEALNHGDDETLAALARVRLQCATLEEVSRLAEVDTTGEPLFVTIDTMARPAQVRRYAWEPVPRPEMTAGAAYEDFEKLTNAWVDARIAKVGALLRGALGELALDEATAADSQAERAARALLGGEEITPALVLQVAPALHVRAARVRHERAPLIRGLAAAVRAEVIAKPVSGSRWGLAGGCGISIEDAPDDEQSRMRVACGMGHVPAKSERFLYLFTRMPWERP
jgi:hypothetical protein